jgi:four helix bundle protein
MDFIQNLILEEGGEYKSYKDFTSLICWQDCRDVKLYFHKEILKNLPKEEIYNMGNQIRKSARSITANIAEGAGRFNYQEAIQFLRIARGSLYELKDDLIFCKDLEVISESNFNLGIAKIEKAKASTSGFIRYLNNKKNETKTAHDNAT